MEITREELVELELIASRARETVVVLLGERDELRRKLIEAERFLDLCMCGCGDLDGEV